MLAPPCISSSPGHLLCLGCLCGSWEAKGWKEFGEALGDRLRLLPPLAPRLLLKGLTAHYISVTFSYVTWVSCSTL